MTVALHTREQVRDAIVDDVERIDVIVGGRRLASLKSSVHALRMVSAAAKRGETTELICSFDAVASSTTAPQSREVDVVLDGVAPGATHPERHVGSLPPAVAWVPQVPCLGATP